MDNLTHSLTGLFLSRAGFNRVFPAATPLLMVAANLPDADVVSWLAGSASYLHFHRHLTHSLMAAPLFALALVGIFRLFRVPVPFLGGFAAALCGVLSHLALDLTNNYGVRLLLPFSGTWFHWDLTPVIDVWIWSAFAVALAGPLLGRLIGSEIGERKNASSGRGLAIAALFFLVLYNGGRSILHSRVIAMLDSREYSGAPPRRVAAFPESMNPLAWRGVAETDTAYQLFQINLPASFDPAIAETVDKALPSASIDEAAKTDALRVMTEFAIFPVYSVTPRPELDGGEQVQLSDLRFPFVSTALLNGAGQVEKSWFAFRPVSPR